MGIRECLIDYMEKMSISPKLISEKTKIPLIKLQRKGKRSLNAEELCILCAELGVRPENFYEKKIPKEQADLNEREESAWRALEK